jgi:DNA polymerase III alpha subunit
MAYRYVELHARSAFSFLEGSSVPEELAETVTTKLKTVGTHPHSVFTDVECVLACLGGSRITVRDHHLGKGSTI